MNPYSCYEQLLFTFVRAPLDEVIAMILGTFNEPAISGVEQALKSGASEVHVTENGCAKVYRPGDAMPARSAASQYFRKELELDFALAYINTAECNTTIAQRILFWEPKLYPNTVAFMGNFDDGMSHSVWSLSKQSPREWINIRIYDGTDYPGCFFDYYADHQRTSRRIMSSKDINGWEFVQEGTMQSFENSSYYKRRLLKNRLNREIVTEYMGKLGIDIVRNEFWETARPAILLYQTRSHLI
jgi:hypothetical protein